MGLCGCTGMLLRAAEHLHQRRWNSALPARTQHDMPEPSAISIGAPATAT